jgi:hypothetical protein
LICARVQSSHFGKAPCDCANPRAEKSGTVVPSSLVSLVKLAEARRAAFRRGVWFRVLNRVERGVVDLTMRYVDDIKSSKLAKVLTAILDKLALATESMADRLVRTVGVPLAKKMSIIAVNWGNVSASGWAEDAGFARYLAFCLQKT